MSNHCAKNCISKIHYPALLLSLFMFSGLAYAEKAAPSATQQQQKSMSQKQATQGMATQAMTREQTKSMTQLMDQMHNTMQSMSQLMEKHRMLTQTQLSEVAGVMQKLSTNMQQATKELNKGKYNEKDIAMLQDRTKDLDRTLDKIKDQIHKE